MGQWGKEGGEMKCLTIQPVRAKLKHKKKKKKKSEKVDKNIFLEGITQRQART